MINLCCRVQYIQIQEIGDLIANMIYKQSQHKMDKELNRLCSGVNLLQINKQKIIVAGDLLQLDGSLRRLYVQDVDEILTESTKKLCRLNLSALDVEESVESVIKLLQGSYISDMHSLERIVEKKLGLLQLSPSRVGFASICCLLKVMCEPSLRKQLQLLTL